MQQFRQECGGVDHFILVAINRNLVAAWVISSDLFLSFELKEPRALLKDQSLGFAADIALKLTSFGS